MLVEVSDLEHRIRGRTVLSCPGFTVVEGRHTLLLGPSGSGKSTLLNILTGLITPTSGEVNIAGERLSDLRPGGRDRLRRRMIGIVFQNLRLISALSVRQNLSLAQHIALGRDDPDAVGALIEGVGLAHRADARPRELSQGEAQRAAIARALCVRPKIIVADEPTSALDDDNAVAMCDLLTASAQTTGATLIIATHDRRLKDRFAEVLTLKPPGAVR
ncbi:ABC transporter ATP-binding protein [Phenylobacterium conjunctum]|jgi:putative ABC transport system ATP-binding protein|uniref:ABC transporter ATP-binding protein n=1 Tax=Phenylobacterium conjunctum TaxID=1298959 RepID=A0ABW3SW65_9CAUL